MRAGFTGTASSVRTLWVAAAPGKSHTESWTLPEGFQAAWWLRWSPNTLPGQTDLTCLLSPAGGPKWVEPAGPPSSPQCLECFYPGPGTGGPSPVSSQWSLKLPQPPRFLSWEDRGSWVSLAHYPRSPTFLSPTAQKQRQGCCWERDLASSPPHSKGGARCSAPGSSQGPPGPPAICSEMSFALPSRPAQQGFWHLGTGGRPEGPATQGGGRGGRGLAAGIGPARPPLASWLWVGQRSRWGE